MSPQPLQIPALSEALYLHQCGRLAEANILFRKIIEAEPHNHVALHSLGVLVSEEKNLKKARDFVEEAITLSPKTTHYYRTLGHILVKIGDYSAAKSAFRTALFLEPLHADTLLGLGEIAEIENDYYNAIAYYKEAIEANPHCGQTHLKLAQNMQAAGFGDECLKYFERAHSLMPYSLTIIVEYAEALLLSCRYIPCRKLLDYAADYYPCHPELQYIHARLYMKIECYDLAVCHFESALEHLNNDCRVLYDYAECLKLLGDDLSARDVEAKIDHLNDD